MTIKTEDISEKTVVHTNNKDSIGFKTLKFKNDKLTEMLDRMLAVQASLYTAYGLPSTFTPPFNYPPHAFWYLDESQIAQLESFGEDVNIQFRKGNTPLSGKVFILNEDDFSEKETIMIDFTPLEIFQPKIKDEEHLREMANVLMEIYNPTATFYDELENSSGIGNLTPDLLVDIYHQTKNPEGITEEFYKKVSSKLSLDNTPQFKCIVQPTGESNSLAIGFINEQLQQLILELIIVRPYPNMEDIIFVVNFDRWTRRAEEFAYRIDPEKHVVFK